MRLLVLYPGRLRVLRCRHCCRAEGLRRGVASACCLKLAECLSVKLCELRFRCLRQIGCSLDLCDFYLQFFGSDQILDMADEPVTDLPESQPIVVIKLANLFTDQFGEGITLGCQITT